jgi:hypothetical protein
MYLVGRLQRQRCELCQGLHAYAQPNWQPLLLLAYSALHCRTAASMTHVLFGVRSSFAYASLP